MAAGAPIYSGVGLTMVWIVGERVAMGIVPPDTAARGVFVGGMALSGSPAQADRSKAPMTLIRMAKWGVAMGSI